ncbi:MAG: peptidoglycan DD-metalloendopeptidase family protein [Xanthomonadales bacterium]|nr:peptidoglycan DD-metalloendopeptidase family protein [Xanthomonadaceae bacterium]MBN8224424.1 peptidoglycan DD-metalloendopeptidase family protein [Xanthomonadales bacterium]MCA0197512.1 M23 family metallopeptidase [Pseudomonadota bacterium]HRF83926.1 M23 family metallopeptidase [Pseudoxanthomonas sp.]
MPLTDHGRGRKQQFHERLGILHHRQLHRKLKERFPAAFNTRWTRRHWLHASLFVTLGALLATIVPGFSAQLQPTAQANATLPLQLPPLTLHAPARDAGVFWDIVQVESGQTLGEVFESMGVPAATMHRILDNPANQDALARLRPGAELGFALDEEGALRGFRFDRNPTQRVELDLRGETIHEKVLERATTTRLAVTSAEIDHSLYAAGRKAGLSPAAIAVMTDEIFKYDIDFKDVQPGDRFSAVVEETWREGERIGTGKILAATFTTDKKTYTGFRFDRNGKAEYFTAEGRPLKKSFIRMPIPYARLSSSFGSRRHPVLGTMRMHKGVDYAAGTGTPIMAAGDARVQFVGQQRGYGNVVILDHGRGHTTLYAHMSRFGKLKKGQQVAQGSVIGYVGSTGLATGPHLHYEFRVNGVHRNPLSVTMPPPEPLKGADLAAFKAATAPTLARMESMEQMMFAHVDSGKAKKR